MFAYFFASLQVRELEASSHVKGIQVYRVEMLAALPATDHHWTHIPLRCVHLAVARLDCWSTSVSYCWRHWRGRDGMLITHLLVRLGFGAVLPLSTDGPSQVHSMAAGKFGTVLSTMPEHEGGTSTTCIHTCYTRTHTHTTTPHTI